MKTIVQLLFLAGVLSISIFSQDINRKKAAENPLDTAYYLITSAEDPDTYSGEITQLSAAYSNLNRQKEALKLPELLGEFYVREKAELYIDLAEASLKKKDEKEAVRLLSLALQNVHHNEYDIGFDNLNKLAYNLALTGNDELVQKLITSIDNNYFKAEMLIECARALQEKGRNAQALLLLPEAMKLVEESASRNERSPVMAHIAIQYAESGRTEISTPLFKKIEEEAIRDSGLFGTIFDIYLKFNLTKRAAALLQKQENLPESEKAFKYAELSWKNGNKIDAIKFIQQAAAFENNSDESAKKTIRNEYAQEITLFFLRISEDSMALDFAQNIKEVVPQQDSFLKIADYYYQHNQFGAAEITLNTAFEKLTQADKSDFDFGNSVIWVNGERLSREFYLRIIADGLMILNKPDSARAVVNAINIPYERAGGLISLSLKRKIPRQMLFQNLSIAKLLIESDKESLNAERKVNYWATIGRMYDEAGDTRKSQKIFADIINRINDEDKLREDEKLSLLITVGIQMGKLTNKNNPEVNEALKKFIDKWKSDED